MQIPEAVTLRCLTPRALGLILLPTEHCNFRCTYCYEDFALGRMAPGVVSGVKELLSARAAELDELTLAWFGGEPTLALDIVEDVQSHAQGLVRRFPRLRLSANMTTNGWKLTPDVFTRLLSIGVDDYQISFDGPPEHHDRKRVRAGGKPSFDRIWRHVVAMRDRSDRFKIRLRLHVDHENLEAMFPFVDRCRATFGDDPRFEMFLKPLSRYGGPNDADLSLLSGDEDWMRFADLQACVAGARAPEIPRSSGPPAVGHGEICYAARGNHFVVRSDGRLCKCTIILDDPRNQVGRLREDGTVEVSAAAMEPWLRGLWSGRESELVCPLQGLPEIAVAAS
jgi:uncharacterized protein